MINHKSPALITALIAQKTRMNKRIRPFYRLLALAIGSMVLAIFAPTVVQAADPVTLESLDATTKQLQISVDTTWVLLTGFLVFFMQTGF